MKATRKPTPITETSYIWHLLSDSTHLHRVAGKLGDVLASLETVGDMDVGGGRAGWQEFRGGFEIAHGQDFDASK